MGGQPGLTAPADSSARVGINWWAAALLDSAAASEGQSPCQTVLQSLKDSGPP